MNMPDGALSDEPTRRRILELITAEGPVTAATLAQTLGLTAAGVRRHLGHLEESGAIIVHRPGSHKGATGRGRPARAFVVAPGRSGLPTNYRDLALNVLRHLQVDGGKSAVRRFAAAQYEDVVQRVGPTLTASDQVGRAQQLADALTADGFAATLRPVTATMVPITQLCQGHCPVRHVAAEFPELCEAEANAFSRLLGTHVQRLATIAGGAHACVTNIPLSMVSTNLEGTR